MNTFHYLNDSEQICSALIEFHECFPGLLDRVESIERYALKLSEAAFVVVMKEDGKNVGFCCYYANDKETLTGYISLIGIKKAYQRMGNGKSLLEFTANRCRESQMTKLKLEVDADNENAIAFYKRNGFQIIRKAREESYYMEKVL